jgi:hypothetical protein
VHAVGARLHPLDAFDPDRVVQSFNLPGLGREAPLYVTCKGGFRAKKAAERLVDAGYPNVTVIDGGTDAWEAANLPVVRQRAAQTLPIAQQVQIAVGLLLLVKTFLGATVHPAFFILTAGLGVGLVYSGLTQNCALAQLLSKMPWNRARLAESSA